MIGDLHCHSKLSDGSTGLDDIVFYAKRAGLDALAITDHDTMSGVPRAEILGRRYGLTVIPGVRSPPLTQTMAGGYTSCAICRTNPMRWPGCSNAPWRSAGAQASG